MRRSDGLSSSSLLAFLVLVAACDGDPIEVTVSSFERPGHVAFVCFSADGSPVALSRCGEGNDDLTLHALVTQTSRGEVAAVDLRANRIIDSDKRVPGATFLPVGELPSAIVVPPNDPTFAYVADMGSGDVVVIPTRAFRGGGEAVTRIELDGAATDLVLSPDETALFAAIPDLGTVARIPLPADETTVVEYVAVGTDVPAAVAATPRADPYCWACYPATVSGCALMQSAFPTDAAGVEQPYPPRDPVALGTVPRPVALEIDADAGVLLVADEALPVVHRFAIDTMVEEPGIATAVPTTTLALTPAVPETVRESTTTARYLYAIDATDRSVLVVDYVEGSVLPVDVTPGRTPDRLELGSAAAAVEVLTPGYPDTVDAACDGSEGPFSLRGVFVAVAGVSGVLRLIDVHDLDAPCRGGAVDPDGVAMDGSGSQCEDAVGDDRVFAIRRHRPRIGERLSSDPVRLTTPPELVREGVESEVIFQEGNPVASLDDGTEVMLALDGCGSGQAIALDDGAEAGANVFLCALSDPWASRAEPWVASFEGLLPGGSGSRGRLVRRDGAPIFEGEASFCERGVLGSADIVGAPAPESALVGDMVVITSEPPPSSDDKPACAELAFNDFGQLAPLELPIVRAYADRLEVAPQTRTGTTFEELRDCYGELFSYEIRSQRVLTVAGASSGFLHRVVADETTGACIVDETQSERLDGRARFGTTFDNGMVRFQLASSLADGLEDGDQLVFRFAISEVPGTLFIAVGTLPRTIRYSPVDQRLYAVDTGSQGLVQMSLSPLTIDRAFD